MKKVIKFVIFGVSNVIPGVCSATVAIILDIYEELLDAIMNIFKPLKWRNHISIYFSILLDAFIGVILLNKLYYFCPFLLNICFLGFVMRQYPLKINKEKTPIKFIPYIIGTIIVITLNLINNFILQLNYEIINYQSVIVIIMTAIIVAIGMILPGISGALMLVSFGLYFPLLDGIMNMLFFITKQGPFNLNSFILIVTFSISFIIGLVVFSKIIKKRIKDNSISFNSFINGMIMATLINIILDLRNHFTSWLEVVVGIVLLTFIYLIPKKNKVNL